MQLQRVKAFELFNTDKHCISSDKERLVFRSMSMAEKVKDIIGGQIRNTFIHVKKGE